MAAAAMLFFLQLGGSAVAAGGESIDFRGDWRFAKGDQEGAEQIDFDDASWTPVRLPHDWAIAGPFDPSEPLGFAAKLPWKGVGWYRKSFKLDRTEGDRVYLDFDGVMAFPKVYVNGQLAGVWDYGYTSFRVDATPYVNLKGDNVVAVRVDTTNHGTRWYPGAGIYRKVTLEVRRPVHLAHWGVFVTTPEVSDDAATVSVDATAQNRGNESAPAVVEFAVIDADGKTVADQKQDVTLQPGDNELKQSLNVEKPLRWDVDHPHLYTLRTTVRVGGESVDVSEEPLGFRTYELTANDGFHLNGRRVQLYGVNLHHDHGPLGAAFYTRAMERQLEIMKEMGVNALRTSHNAPAPEVLALCDRMGILVWDECFDKWNETADLLRRGPSHQEHGERHLRSMVMRDRNHPSIIVWSIGNEISGGQGATPDRVKMFADIVRRYDPTRSVGIGCHIPDQVREGMFEGVDFTGWNYARRYARYRERYPDKPIIYSESASALSARGFYELPLPTTKTDYSDQGQVDSYDFNAAPWSDIADKEFKLMKDDPFVAGEFVWTGFDYLGEPTPFERQAVSSYFGIVDLCGMPKDRYWLYRSYWRPDVPTVHILPHWNWPDRVGQPVPVFVYTNGDSAELFLNGKSLGRRTKGQRPEAPEDFALRRTVTASSSETDHPPDAATDGDPRTRWCAADGEDGQWIQVDLGQERPLKQIAIEFEGEAKNYGYTIKVSSDLNNWDTVVTQRTSREPVWGGPPSALHAADATARYVRIEFTDLRRNTWASICELGVYAAPTELPYYDPIYDYRLRWNDVVYEPGELRAVAYRNGQEVGSATMRTAGEPATIRLTPDRTELVASGDDLCYVQVEAFDKDGVPCPLAENAIEYRVEGPAEIAGLGNGNPLSLAPFQSSSGKLFFGKAMLIVRTKSGNAGEIRITASGEAMQEASAVCRSAAP
jgi:beta-galactosidase